jgi:hypothetical protein
MLFSAQRHVDCKTSAKEDWRVTFQGGRRAEGMSRSEAEGKGA